MGQRKNKTWTAGNKQIGVRLDPSLMRLVDSARAETGDTRAEYFRRLLIEKHSKKINRTQDNG